MEPSLLQWCPHSPPLGEELPLFPFGSFDLLGGADLLLPASTLSTVATCLPYLLLAAKTCCLEVPSVVDTEVRGFPCLAVSCLASSCFSASIFCWSFLPICTWKFQTLEKDKQKEEGNLIMQMWIQFIIISLSEIITLHTRDDHKQRIRLLSIKWVLELISSLIKFSNSLTNQTKPKSYGNIAISKNPQISWTLIYESSNSIQFHHRINNPTWYISFP